MSQINTSTPSDSLHGNLDKTWDVARTTGRAGTGNWDAYNLGMDPIYAASEKWKAAIQDVPYPWLCWNIDDNWCQMQQRLVLEVGWTPVIGWDPNSCPTKRTVLPGAVAIDFNAEFSFPAMWPHFPLEFAFLWADRLAFWHADLLVRIDKLRQYAEDFRKLPDGEMYAVKPNIGLRSALKFKEHRYWELLGCTTAGASRSQFETGCGWWRHFYSHPNTPASELSERRQYYYDSGVGIRYWQKRYNGIVHLIPERLIAEGHCTQIGKKTYIKSANKSAELLLNFDLPTVAEQLGLQAFI